MKVFSWFFLVCISGSVNSQTLSDQGIITTTDAASLSGKIFFEHQGIVSMEAENASYCYGWKRAVLPFDTWAMEADSSATWRGGVLRFDIEFSRTGRYAIWVMGRKGRHSLYGANDVKVWFDRDLALGLKPSIAHRNLLKEGIIDGNGYQSTPDPLNNTERRESEINFAQNQAFLWMSNPKDGVGPAWWDVKTTGKHHIEFVMGEEYGYAIDKLVLTLDNSAPPEGRGPQETDSAGIRSNYKDEIILPPRWAFGVLYGGYTNQVASLERVQSIIRHDYPIDAYWIDSWFWDFAGSGRGPRGFLNFTGDSLAFPDVKNLWDEFSQLNIKAGVWIWDVILQDGNEKVFDEFRKNHAFSDVFVNKVSWHNEGGKSLCGQINFEDSAATSYFQEQLKPLFEKGLDFLKLDRGPQVPFARGVSEAIQKYGKETQGRAFIMQHVGDLHNPEHKKYPTKWSGDSEMSWSSPSYPNTDNYTKGGLTQNIEMVANPRRYDYDVPFLTHDGGGFRIIGSKDFGEELFIRWIQFSMFSPITEIFQSLFNSSGNLAWNYSPRADSIYRQHSQLRMRLFPYIYTYAHRTRLYGDRICKGDGLHPTQYLFGNEFLACPVNEPGAQKKKVFFPAGEWINYWTGEKISGSQTLEVDAPIQFLPLYVRAGAIVPMRDYARSIEQGNNKHLTLDIYPSGTSTFELIEDDGESNAYLQGMVSKTAIHSDLSKSRLIITIGKAVGGFTGMHTERDYSLQIHLDTCPREVRCNGVKFRVQLSGAPGKGKWTYDSRSKILSLKLKTKTALESQLVASW